MPALITVITLLAVFTAVSYAVYRKGFYNRNINDVTHDVLKGPDYDPYRDRMTALINDAVKIPFSGVSIVSYDGLRLYGRIYFTSSGAPFHIQFNGYKGNGIRDFSGGLQLALKTGGNVLLVDQRAHGGSDGHTITFGIRERRDVISWIDYINKTYDAETDIYIEGVSMGAASVLMASELPLPGNVRGIIADCPYSSPFAIVSRTADRMLRVRYVSYPFIILGSFIFGRFRIFSSSAVKAVKKSPVPILIIHGKSDSFVPVEMSREIRDSAPDIVTLTEIDGAPHGLSYLEDTEKYEKAFRSFIENTIGGGCYDKRS